MERWWQSWNPPCRGFLETSWYIPDVIWDQPTYYWTVIAARCRSIHRMAIPQMALSSMEFWGNPSSFGPTQLVRTRTYKLFKTFHSVVSHAKERVCRITFLGSSWGGSYFSQYFHHHLSKLCIAINKIYGWYVWKICLMCFQKLWKIYLSPSFPDFFWGSQNSGKILLFFSMNPEEPHVPKVCFSTDADFLGQDGSGNLKIS